MSMFDQRQPHLWQHYCCCSLVHCRYEEHAVATWAQYMDQGWPIPTLEQLRAHSKCIRSKDAIR